MKEKRTRSPQSTDKNLIQQYKNSRNTQTQRFLISCRIEGQLLDKIEQEHDNRSEAIRQALKEKYGRGEA